LSFNAFNYCVILDFIKKINLSFLKNRYTEDEIEAKVSAYREVLKVKFEDALKKKEAFLMESYLRL